MAERNEDGTSKNQGDWGVPDKIGCNRCGQPLDEHEGKMCPWMN